MITQKGDCARIAFFGGSFDPPHQGHLAVARAARAALSLNIVLFAPVGAQPLKPLGSTASFEDRLAMTKLAIQDEPGFEISLVDGPAQLSAADGAPEKPPGFTPNYTIDTLNRLRGQLPANDTLFCLMGADSFLGLRRWRRGAEIPFAARLIVTSRPGQELGDLASVLPAGLSIEPDTNETGTSAVEVKTFRLRSPTGATNSLYLLPGLAVDVSASEVRGQVHAARGGLPGGHDLLPDAVLGYIAAHGLYR
jgi:nicotinate-nucleotide adenylyltransferase